MVTSSAVVGSSAISSFGSQDSAIAIATRWRMPPDSWCGILRQALLRRGNADRGQQLDGAPGRRRDVELEMLLQCFDQLRADGEHRIERCHRILEHHRKRARPQLAQGVRRKAREILPVEQHAAGELRLLGHELQDRARQHGLAAAGLADNAERPARVEREIDSVDSTEIATRRRQVDGDVLDGQQRGSVHSAP